VAISEHGIRTPLETSSNNNLKIWSSKDDLSAFSIWKIGPIIDLVYQPLRDEYGKSWFLAEIMGKKMALAFSKN